MESRLLPATAARSTSVGAAVTTKGGGSSTGIAGSAIDISAEDALQWTSAETVGVSVLTAKNANPRLTVEDVTESCAESVQLLLNDSAGNAASLYAGATIAFGRSIAQDVHSKWTLLIAQVVQNISPPTPTT